jgi:uncharacterized protein (DUF1697 family)
MPKLKSAFEAAGFKDVKTVLSSGNVVFSSAMVAEASLERKAEAAMQQHLGREFLTIVRPVDALRQTLASDPYQAARLPSSAKRIVTFLRGRPHAALKLPIELDGAHIVAMKDGEVFSAYLPSPKGPVFMSLIEKTFGKQQTTRTWDTLTKVVRAAS